jgi:amino acid adenylation domain-containing protein
MSISDLSAISDDKPGANHVWTAMARWATETPTATAASAADGTLDFAELLRTTRAIASVLADRGVGPGTSVGVGSGRSRLTLPGLFAIWWLGATAVPVDDSYPADRVNFILRDAGVKLLLADRIAVGVLPAGVRRVGFENIDTADAGPEPTVAGADDCAYVIYTSGTTGWPKGVEVTYANLATFLAAIADLGLTPGGVGANPLSPAFDGWLWNVLLHLMHGQGTAMIDLSDGEPGDLAERMAAVAPRTISMPPTLVAACIDQLPTVETVVIAGERCPSGLAERLAGRQRVLNVYGPTEATMAATWADSARGDDIRSIGRPLPGYAAHVLDEAGAPVPDGGTGELYIGGPAVARGYRNRPELTAERFPTLPSGERVYRTGDLVTVRPDGLLDFAGRVDDQVKVRGFRVELREVEQVAEEEPGITGAAAFVLESGDSLGLAVVPATGAAVDANALRVRCKERLPEFMVPGIIEVMTALPATANGKVDRELLAREAAVSAPVLEGRGPSTPQEVAVCDAWSAVLKRRVADVDANFFELGGHSLLAARAVAELRAHTGVKLSMRDLLAHPTPAGLAGELAQRLAGDAAKAKATTKGTWLVPWSGRPAGRPTLLCLPPAGSGCGRFRRWQAQLGDSIAVVGVQPPGREERLGEAHPSSWEEVVATVTREVLAFADPDQPLVVLGESMGGLLGYEVTRRLGAHDRWPAALVLAACEPPELRAPTDVVVASSRTALGKADVDEDSREQVVELMHRDLALVADYRLPREARLPVPVHVWGGDLDDLVPYDKLEAWRDILGPDIERRQFPGTHTFAMNVPDVVRLLGELVALQGASC